MGERRQVPRHNLCRSVHLRDGLGARLWSNGAVADEDNGASPWERDDWIPDSVVPDPGMFGRSAPPGRADLPGAASGSSEEPPPEDFEGHPDADGRRRGSTGRTLVAGAIVAALVIGSAGALLQGGDDPVDPVPPSDPSTTIVNEGSPVTTAAPTISLPTVDGDLEAAASAQVVTVTAAPDASGEVVIELVELSSLEVGVVPVWTEIQIAVPEELSAMAPTDLITLSHDEVVAVTQLPSGRSRQIDVSILGPDTQLVVGDEAIAVFSSTDIATIRAGEPVVVTAVNDGIIFVESWTGTRQLHHHHAVDQPERSRAGIGAAVGRDDRVARCAPERRGAVLVALVLAGRRRARHTPRRGVRARLRRGSSSHRCR